MVNAATPIAAGPPVFPFTAIAGQSDMKNALLIAAIDPAIGGVLLLGDRGTGKSTAIRALARLLPPMKAVAGCPYSCDPAKASSACPHCSGQLGPRRTVTVPVPVIDLPLGATEDRVVGALDLERALTRGERSFEPGLLAKANRGFLYIDEVNLLEDHLVDLLLDVAASGENVVERDGLSVRHPARFVLIGSGNPEEGELRPQLLDRFGLCVEVRTPTEIEIRIEAVKRREAFEADPAAFSMAFAKQEAKLGRRVLAARKALPTIATPDPIRRQATELCLTLGTDGLRGEMTLLRAARAMAALAGDSVLAERHLAAMAPAALGHRLRRAPLDEIGATLRVERAIAELQRPGPPLRLAQG